MKDVAGAKLLANAQILSRAARRVARGRLASRGLNDQRAALIAYLHRHGQGTLYEIADRLDLHRPATAALLARMQDDGLISWTSQATDGGHFALTAQGAALVPAVRAEILRVRAEALEGLETPEIEAACNTLLQLIANLQRG